MDFQRKRTRGQTRSLLSITAWALLAGVPSAAAAQTGTVTGRVLASTGEVVPFAAVQWEGSSRWVTVQADGRFLLAGVPVGTRTIVTEALGYRTTSQSVDVPDGGSVTVNLSLETRPIDVAGIRVSVLRPDLTPVAQLDEREVREANPKDVGELLREMEGVDAVRRGPLGLDPVVRGLRETEVGTYLDGTRLEPAGPARMDSPLTHLDPSAVRSVEVIKGPYALTWGAGNLSAIRVETQPLPETDTRPRGGLAAGFDSNLGAWETSVNARGREGMISYTVDGAWRQGDDYVAGDGTDVPADFESWEGRGKLGIDVGSDGQLILQGGYQEQGPIDYPGRLLTAETFEAPTFAGTFQWSGEGTLGSLELKGYRNQVDHTMSNRDKPTELDMAGRTPPCALDIGVDSKIVVSGGRAAAELNLGEPWSAEVGGDLYNANGDATRTIQKSSSAALNCGNMLDNPGAAIVTRMWPDATIRDIGSFGRLAWSARGVTVSGTVRLDFVSADAPSSEVSSYFTTNNPSGSDLKASETNVSAALTASYNVDQNWVLALGVGSAVRTADATERYSDRIPATKAQFAAEFMGDPQLKPERSTQADIWADGRYDDFLVHFGAFYRKMSDYITILERTDLTNQLPLSVPPRVYQYINGEATFYGVDASASVGVTPEVTLTARGAYLYGQDDELDEPAIGVAPLQGSLAARYEDPAGRFYLEAIESVIGEQTRVASTRNEAQSEGYQTLDVRGGIGLPNGVTVRAGVLNVFDKYYFNHLNARNPFALPDRLPVPEPGRVFFIDLMVAF